MTLSQVHYHILQVHNQRINETVRFPTIEGKKKKIQTCPNEPGADTYIPAPGSHRRSK